DFETVAFQEPPQPKAGFWSGLLGRDQKAPEPRMRPSPIAPGAAREEGEGLRPVLLACVDLPGRFLPASQGRVERRSSIRARRLTASRGESIRLDLEVMDIADSISHHDGPAVRSHGDCQGCTLQGYCGSANSLLKIPESKSTLLGTRQGMAAVR